MMVIHFGANLDKHAACHHMALAFGMMHNLYNLKGKKIMLLFPFKNIFFSGIEKNWMECFLMICPEASFLYLHGLCRQLENGAPVWQLYTVGH